MEPTHPVDEVTPNRAARRAAARRGRKLAALSSGAVLAGGAGAAVMSALTATPAAALTQHTVNALGDAGDLTCDLTCTLRDAADDAANDGDDSQIVFAPSVTGTITLTTGDIILGNGTDSGFDLTITGPGAGALTVQNDGVTLDRIFTMGSDFDGATASISGLTIANGSVANDGGGLYFYNAGDLVLTDVVITGNKTTTSGSNDGGGVNFYNSGNLTVTNSTISGNFTALGADGGGVFFYNAGNMTVTNSTISGNTATGSGNGGGIKFYNSNDLTVTNSTFSGNDGNNGGGIKFYQAGDMIVTGSTISGNTSTFGGGIKLYDSTSLTVTSSTITGNHAISGAGGGIMFYQGGSSSLPPTSFLTITDSTISGNDATTNGGGIQFYDRDNLPDPDSATTLTITSSTISGNTAGRDGGGLYFYGDTGTIANSTFANNSAADDGGGIAVNGGDLALLQSTISGNTAGPDAVDLGDGLYLRGAGAAVNAAEAESSDKPPKDTDEGKAPKPARVSSEAIGALAVGTIDLAGTIVSANAQTDLDTNSAVTVNSTASLWGTKGAGITINDLGGTINSTSPGLGPLANNGGPTQTMALLTGSPALDAGPDPVPSFSGNGFDQRGSGFPRVVNGRVDIGAYEAALVVLFTG